MQKKLFLKKIKEGRLTDDQLANMVEEAIHNGFYNFWIVDEAELKGESDEYPDLYLNDINNLPEYNDAG